MSLEGLLSKSFWKPFQSQVMPDNLIACHENMRGSVGKRTLVDVDIICSFSMAFDTATHSIFIAELLRFKWGEWMISWMENWLNCWVAIGSSKSSWWLITTVIPQVLNTVVSGGKCVN